MKSVIKIERLIDTINQLFLKISLFCTCIMMAFVCIDVLMRYFGHPILGSNDIVTLLLVVIIAFSMGHTYALNRYTRITIVISRLPKRLQALVSILTNGTGLGIFILLMWQSLALGNRMAESGEGSMTLGIPLHPFLYCVAIGCVLIGLVLLVEIKKSVIKVVR